MSYICRRVFLPFLVCFSYSLFTSCVLYEEAPPYSPTPCKINEYVQNGVCVLCPEGTSRPAGDAINKGDTACLPVNCEENQRVSSNACVPCKAGEVNEAGDDASGVDTLCEVIRCAMNQRVQNNQCVSCDGGTFNSAGDLANSADTECDGFLCGKDQYVKENTCLMCEPGTVRAAGDDASKEDTQCEPLICAENQRVQANICVSCPAGTISQAGADATGVDTECQPIICMINQYVSANQCLPCSKGSTRPAGDLASGEDTQCEPTLCEADQRVQSNSCVPCAGKRINEAGDNATGQDTQCVPFAFSSISAGSDHTCGVTIVGRVKCWGSNREKQLGVDTVGSIDRPVDVPGLRNVVMIDAGGAHTCAVLKGGQVACWGKASVGRLGKDLAEDVSRPVIVPGIENATKVVLGGAFSCALDGQSIKCWGWNIAGQLGDGEKLESRATPSSVASKSSFVDVAAGSASACGLTDSGNVECWGRNDDGHLGADPSLVRVLEVPVTVNGINGAAKGVSIGSSHMCVRFTQDVKCIGSNRSGQLGRGETFVSSFELEKVNTTSSLDALNAGGSHTCIISGLGGASCWGSNFRGQLGDGSTDEANIPVRVEQLSTGIVGISAGFTHTCAISNVGVVKCWGANGSGQLGIGTTSGVLVPTEVIP